MLASPLDRLADALRAEYALERELGHGGMATVYFARDVRHARPVAIKVVRPEVVPLLGTERFLREIEIAAQLQHPHIVPLYDSGNAAGLLYYVMPYIEGESLRHRLERDEKLPLGEVLRLTREVASALDYAHAQGLVHRDIKPENILLSGGHAVVSDFGLARAVSRATLDRDRLTTAGVALGTPAYMSPEQVSGEMELDARSDVYSLACVVYEMLAGQPPFRGPAARAAMAERLNERLDGLRRVRRDLSPSVERSLIQALALWPGDRQSSAGEFAEAMHARGRWGAFPPALGRRRTVTIASGVVALALVVVLGAVLRSPGPAAAGAHRQLTFTGSATWPALSRDGRWLAYSLGDTSLVVQRLPSGESHVLVQRSRFIERPRWSPDGTRIAFAMYHDDSTRSGTYVIARGGGPPRKVIDDVAPFAWDADGTALARAYRDTLTFVDLETGTPTRILSLAPRGVTFSDDIEISPDGRWIALSAVDEFGILSRDGGIWHRLGTGASPRLRWSSTGEALYTVAEVGSAADLHKLRIDPASGEPRGRPHLVLSGLSRRARLDLATAAGVLVYARTPVNEQIWTMTVERSGDRLSAKPRQRTFDTREHLRVDLSPDGQWLAYSQREADALRLYVTPFGEGEGAALARKAVSPIRPRWSPDGRRLAFLADEPIGMAVMLWHRADGRIERLDGGISPAPVLFKALDWSADGNTLLAPGARGRSIAVLRLDGRPRASLAYPESAGSFVAWVVSPNGREVLAAGMGRPNERFRLWRATLHDGSWTRTRGPPGDAIPLRWIGDWIYLWVDQDAAGVRKEIWRVPAAGGAPEPYVQLPVDCFKGDLALSQDARRLACRVSVKAPDLWLVTDFDPMRDW